MVSSANNKKRKYRTVKNISCYVESVINKN